LYQCSPEVGVFRDNSVKVKISKQRPIDIKADNYTREVVAEEAGEFAFIC
jgi:hypothetical protein